MSQRLLRPRFVAVAGLLLATSGVVVVACSSDDSPSTNPVVDGSSLSPGGAGGAVNAGSGGAPANTAAGTGTGGSTASEALPTGIPITEGTPPPPAPTGSGGAASEQPPVSPTGALAPNCAPPEGAVPTLALEPVATGLTNPLYVTSAPGDDSRLFVMEQRGVVRVIVDGVLQEQPFADISAQVTNGGERGLLGLAFHPDYANNGLFYLHFSSAGGQGLAVGQTVVAEFAVDPTNRSLANLTSQRQVLTIVQPEANHNGGQLSFGPDGFLYLGFGDGGGANDQHGTIGNGQSLNTLLGKILRIDPTGRAVNNAYSIPPDNLAAATGQQASPEIWAYGMRNPWRFSFDACNGDLYIGDVGQNTVEEIDYLPAGTPAGTNFGWRIMEGPDCRPQDTVCNATTRMGLTLPVDSYGRTIGQSVTGGYVYRGSKVPGLRGTYIYADYQSARFFRFRIQDGAIQDRQEITAQLQPAGVEGIASFGTDNAGEMYIAAFDPGAVYRIVSAP
jgi:glucose/arabinose dehydrogenase